MAGRMIWHDTRLKGTAPELAFNKHIVDETSELDISINWIATYARTQGGLDELIIFCEGALLGVRSLEGKGVRSLEGNEVLGATGLKLCKQSLHQGNVSKLTAWNPGGERLIQRVTIYACAPALTTPATEGRWGDGQRFMGELAIHSGAYVVAPQELQTYSRGKGRFIDFGDWEGPVFLFDPANGKGTPFQPGPMA